MLDPVLPAAAGDQRPIAEPFPVSVDLDRTAQKLTIAWDDGAVSSLEAAALRWACPCAECRGEMGIKGRLDRVDSLAEDELRLETVSLVGQYALAIGFASGHSTGIYTFPYLRSLAEPTVTS